MARRSARVKDKDKFEGPSHTTNSKIPSEDNEDFSADASDSEDEHIIRPRKRNKTSSSAKNDSEKRVQKKLRGKRGILKELTEMPLDIMFEIFGQLYPVDLLNLARTTKALRVILMSRSSITIWRRARNTTVPGFPDCPKDLSEPQYADLIFNSHCQDCLAPKSHSIIWGLMVRLCSTCVSKCFIAWHSSRFRYREVPSIIAELAPKVSIQSMHRRFHEELYHEETLRGWVEEYKKLTDEESVSLWCSEIQLDYKRVSAFAVKCQEGLAQQARDRAQELEQIQVQRKNDIFNKLRELGWGDELEDPVIVSQLESHSLIKQKKALTDRIWANMKPTLLEFLERAKAERVLKHEKECLALAYPILEKLRDQFALTCSPDTVVPPVADIHYFAPFHSIALANRTLAPEHYQEAMAELPQLCHDWREEKDRELLQMIQEVLPDVEVDRTHLLLASTFFRFKDWYFDALLPYPHVLAYPKATVKCNKHLEDKQVEERYSSIREAGWNSYKLISFEKEAFEKAINVIQASRFDPRTTTSEVIDTADPILECPLCTKQGTRCYMTWRRAVYHALKVHNSTEVPWILLEEPFAEKMRQFIEQSQLGNQSTQLLCAHCKKSIDIKILPHHVISEHEKSTCSSEDFIKSLGEDYTPPCVFHVENKWAGRIR